MQTLMRASYVEIPLTAPSPLLLIQCLKVTRLYRTRHFLITIAPTLLGHLAVCTVLVLLQCHPSKYYFLNDAAVSFSMDRPYLASEPQLHKFGQLVN